MFNLSVNSVSGIAVPKVRIDKDFDMSHQDIALLLFMIKSGSFYDIIDEKLRKKLVPQDYKLVSQFVNGLDRIKNAVVDGMDCSQELRAAMTPIVDATKAN